MKKKRDVLTQASRDELLNALHDAFHFIASPKARRDKKWSAEVKARIVRSLTILKEV